MTMRRVMAAFAPPDVDTGAADGGAPDVVERVPLNERPSDGPGSGRGELRKQLETSVETERKGREVREKAPAGKAPGKRQAARPGINHQEGDADPGVAGQTAEGVAGATDYAETAEGDQPQEKALEVPKGFSEDAKAAWATTPAPVQAAILKREQDMARGVEEIKRRYNDIDSVLAPRMQVIQQHGHTPAQAVNQLFAWMDALATRPELAFPALAESFQFDLRKLLGGQQQAPVNQQQQAGANGEQPAGDVPPALQQYIDQIRGELGQMKKSFSEQLGGLQTSFVQATEAKTQEILDQWCKGKPYFEDVRKTMAQLIGSGIIPPLPNGAADLDTAYERAVNFDPAVRARVVADTAAANKKANDEKAAREKKAQQEQVDKARRAQAGSLFTGAPGNPVAPASKKGAGKTVRQSINEAREQLES